ncbi:MAG: dockerin type I repeat-containing protein, partial [Minisyncoccia bacterium]
VNPFCGDNILEFGEQCDGSDLGGQTCLSLGYGGGTLVCNSSCIFDTSGCTPPPPPPPPPSGGGGGGYYYPQETKVIFSGRAYPKSSVTLLKDAQVIATTIAGSDSLFQITVSGLSGGNYIFSLYSEDKNGIRSSLLTFPISVASGATTNVSGIFIAPTIAVDKSEVKRGDDITIFGQSAHNAEITIQVSSDEEFFVKTKSDDNGIYLYNFDTTDLEYGDHFAKSKAVKVNEISPFSKAVSFKVGTKNVFAQKPGKCGKADLNCDGRVNLIDFSIAAYWYKRSISVVFKQIELERLNGDGKIDLVDFSIMAYYWTG